ncbi:FHA domain-containing protein [Hydrogeniiclostridium mannosilyticum]|uniref:FHA domain-containing protein n=1 Tax=Hydrogeniiclostridium mannosilyticum TaxID=2764322 RepID=UPI0018AB29A4
MSRLDLQYSINENGAVFTVRLEPGMILELERQEVLGQVNGVVFCQAVIREGQRFLDYPVSGCRPLEAVCREVMTKEKFLNIEKRLTEAGLAAEAAGISQQLAVEPETAFISEGGARLCYVPVQGFAGAGLRYLLLEVIYRSSFSGEEDCAYAQTVVNFLRNSEPFSLRDFHNLLTGLETDLPPSVQRGPSGTSSEKGGTVLISEAVQLREQAKAEEEARREAEAKAAEEARREAEAKAAEEARREAEAKAEEEARREAEAKAAEEARREAEAKAEEEARREAEAKAEEEARREAEAKAAEEARREAEARAAEEVHREEKKNAPMNLLHEKTGARIPIMRPVLKIGKKAGLVDYCIEGNPSISRRHADIVSRDGGCYLVDRGSLNKSYVNGRIAEPDQEIPLHSGDKISLADEIFTVE